MTRVLVAGYGNPLRSDDGVGWRIAEAVAERWGERICVLMGQQPIPEWAPELAVCDVAFLVDAATGPSSRMRVRRLKLVDGERALDSHTFGPQQLLSLTRALYGHAPETNLLLLPIESVQFGESLSPTTARAAERALRFLDRQLTRWVRPPVPG